MQNAALLGAYDADPVAVDNGELLLVVDALVEIGERFLLVSAAFGGLYHGRGFFAGAAGAFALDGRGRGRSLRRGAIDLRLQRSGLRGTRRSGYFSYVLGTYYLLRFHDRCVHLYITI